MRPLEAIRGRLARVPTTVLRRADAGSARARIIVDARVIAPDLPRGADPGHVVRAARRLVRRAAQDEFAREGVSLVPLPDGWGRAELRRADIPGDASFHAFVEEVLAAVDIAPGLLEHDDALALREAPGSSDAYGLSLETASDLASYLLGCAWQLRRQEPATTDDDGDRPAPRETEASGVGAAATEDEFFDIQAERIRDDVRAVLVRQVRVPLELQAALARHDRLEGAGTRPADQAVPDGDPRGQERDPARQSFARRARTALDFAQSETGRAAFSMLRTGAGKAYERYGNRPGDPDGTQEPTSERPPRGD